jgi:predicted nucleic acid-binding protein
MPDDKLVVSDTSPLLNLALIDRLDLVREQFSTVTVPKPVWDELFDGEEGVEALRGFHDAGALDIVTVEDSSLFVEFRRDLDVGEAAALAYALEADADLVLLDEREARQTARRHDLSMTGAIGILLRGARTGDLDLQTELDALRSAGFWIAEDLYDEVLSRGPNGSE